MRQCRWVTLLGLMIGGLMMGALTGCQSNEVFRTTAQADAFRQRFVDQPQYTAMVLRPYELGDGYLIDLRGRMADEQVGTYRAGTVIPLGVPITITGQEGRFLMAQVEGYQEDFRILLATKKGTVAEVAQELAILISKSPPLQRVRPGMRSFVERQEVAEGMAWREVYMTWGQPDKLQVLPSSSSTLEEWIYFDRRIHVFLENGYVTNWLQM